MGTQRVYIDSQNNVRIVDAGPIGPAGFSTGDVDLSALAKLAGGNNFAGYQKVNLDALEVYTIEDLMAGAEFVPLIGVEDETPIRYLAGAKVDMSFADPGYEIGVFVVEVLHEQSLDGSGPTGRVVITNTNDLEGPGVGTIRTYSLVMDSLSVLSFIGAISSEDPTFTNLMTGMPVSDHDAVPKSYVDFVISGGGTAEDQIRKAVKYGRNAGGKWALVGSPGHYTTADVGPLDKEGIIVRGRVRPMFTDPNNYGSLYQFWELITQFRNADGYTFDQDGLEIALAMGRSRIGFFSEECLIATPYPVASGEYAPGRFYTDGDAKYSGLDLSLGDALEFRYDYLYDNGAGRWEKRVYVRTDLTSYAPENGDLYETLPSSTRQDPSMGFYYAADQEDFYWKRFGMLAGPAGHIGSIADSGLDFHVGRNAGVMGVEYLQMWNADSVDGDLLIFDFQSKDIDPDTGIGESLLVPGQLFVPYQTPDNSDDPTPLLPVVDDSPYGLWATEQRLRSLEAG